MIRLLSIAALAALSGCTAAKASLQIVNAEQAVTRAETQGAQDIAAYEYTMAKLYLEKAQEEAGYSEFRIADALARQSAEWADRAVIFVEKKGRTDIELDDFVLPEKPAEAPKPVPEPAPDAPWLEESDPSTVPGEGPSAEEPEEPEAPEEPDPYEIEEAEEDDIQIGPEATETETESGGIEDTGGPE